MEVTKHVTNLLKGSMRGMIAQNDDHIEKLHELTIILTTMQTTSYKSLSAIIDYLNDTFAYRIPYTNEKTDVFNVVEKITSELKRENIVINTFMKNLRKEGFIDVVYRLPLFALRLVFDYVGMIFLVISGIKVNAEHKSENASMMDDLERELRKIEIEMAPLIEEDWEITPQNLPAFLNAFDRYLRTFYEKEGYREFDKDEIDGIIRDILITVVNYALFFQDAYQPDIRVVKEAFRKKMVEENLTEMETLCELYADYVSNEKACQVEREVAEKEPEPIISEPIETLADYVTDGNLTKLCPIDKFECLLSTSKIDRKTKVKYAREMAEMWNYAEKDAYERKTAEYRRSILSPSEQELYHAISTEEIPDNPTLKIYIEAIDEDIDTLIQECTEAFTKICKSALIEEADSMSEMELYHAAKRVESLSFAVADIEAAVAIIEDHIKIQFEKIKNAMKSQRGTTMSSESTVYYTDNYATTEKDTISIPRLIKRLACLSKEDYLPMRIELSNLIERRLEDDRQMRKNLPCKVFIKGRELKIFYTFVEDTLVIIDAIPADGSEYKQVTDLVRSAEFKEFLDTLKKFISSGVKPNAVNYTKSIMAKLEPKKKYTK